MNDAPTFVCLACGAEYLGHAEYCNRCGGTDFQVDRAAPRPSPSIRSDTSVWALQGGLWLIAVLLLFGERSTRHVLDLAAGWAVTATLGLLLGLSTRNLRVAGLFAATGALFAVAAAWIRGSG